MRDLIANQSTIYYAMYVGKHEVVNSSGQGIGQYAPTYTIPRKFDICVSTPTGANAENPFGNFTNYDKVMTTANKDFKADEYSVLWVDTMPVIKEDGSTDTPFDYKVAKVAPWKNQNAYAISKVVVDMNDADYLLHLLNVGAISQEEYDEYSADLEGNDEDNN